MRKIKLDYIEIGGEKFPIYCDMFVLKQIQDKYTSVNEYQRKILGTEIVRDEDGEPERNTAGEIQYKTVPVDEEAVFDGLAMMINEGIEIENEQEGKSTEPVDYKWICRANDRPADIIYAAVIEAFARCFKRDIKKNKTARK